MWAPLGPLGASSVEMGATLINNPIPYRDTSWQTNQKENKQTKLDPASYIVDNLSQNQTKNNCFNNIVFAIIIVNNCEILN